MTATSKPAKAMFWKRPSVVLGLPAVGLALLVIAQTQFQEQRLNGLAMGTFVGGIICWLLSFKAAPPRDLPSAPLVDEASNPRWDMLGIAVGLASVTWISTTGGVYTTFNVAAWLLLIVVWCCAWWPTSNNAPSSWQYRIRWSTLLPLAFILMIGAFFRFYRLNEVPLDPTSDHAEKLLDVYDLTQGQRPIFFPRNTGREPGQFYITFGLMQLLGLPLRFQTLKFGTALIGLLAIPAIYLLARELGSRGLGLFAATLFAVSKWPVNTARMGLRFPYAPLPTALTLWLLLRYLRRGDRRDALLCGLVIGLGLHGYIAFRIVPLLVPLLFVFAMIVDKRWREQRRRLLFDGGLVAATAVLTCLPLVRYAVQHPEQVWFRVSTRAAGTERTLGDWQALGGTFVKNNWNALLAFNWRGDDTIVNAVRHDPFLDIVTGAALLAGLLIVGYYVIGRRSTRWSMVCLSLPVLLLPSTLSLAFPVENPSTNRLGTVTPIIFTIAALPLAHMVGLWNRHLSEGASVKLHAPGRRRSGLSAKALAPTLIVGGALLLATQQNFVRYFHDYDQQYRSFVPNVHEIADHIQRMEAQGVTPSRTYILAFPYWLDGRNLGLALGDVMWQATHDLTEDHPLPTQQNGQPLLFVLHPEDTTRQAELEARFPHGTYQLVRAMLPGRDFAMFLVPGR